MTILPRIGQVNPGTTGHACADDLLVFSNPPKTHQRHGRAHARRAISSHSLICISSHSLDSQKRFSFSFFSRQDGNGMDNGAKSRWMGDWRNEGTERLAAITAAGVWTRVDGENKEQDGLSCFTTLTLHHPFLDFLCSWRFLSPAYPFFRPGRNCHRIPHRPRGKWKIGPGF